MSQKRNANSVSAALEMRKRTKTNENRWTNKQRTLIFSSRGITFRARHLMEDFRTLSPHSKKDNKLDRKDNLRVINEVCELKNCNNCVFFEMRKKQDLYMWVSKTPDGPSAKFLVENIHTMSELKMVGNCLSGSRPLLSFDKTFDEQSHLGLLKEIFTQSFGVPNNHPKSKPFFDHVYTFSSVDNRIWFRNFQICEIAVGKSTETQLVEIGPRFVLNPIRIFSSSFSGATLYRNPQFKSPNETRREMRNAIAGKYADKLKQKDLYETRQEDFDLSDDEVDDVFN